MANLHKGQSELKKKATTYLTISIGLWMVPIAYIIAFTQGYYFEGIFHLLPIVPAWIAAFFGRKYKILRSGIQGENRTAKILKDLPSGYEIYSSVGLITREGRAELDHVIVGENGIFIVEVKNHNGTIVGNEDSQHWVQHKIGRKGGEYSKEMRNPIKQVRRQVHILSSYLKEHNSKIWIEGIVYFSNRDASIRVRTEKTPVFTTANELHQYLSMYRSKKKLTKAELDHAKNLLNQAS